MPPIGISVLASGSNGNCTIVHCGDQAVMIDCGITLKQLRLRLAANGLNESWIKAILITHEHSDHVSGIAVVAKHLGVPVFATQLCAQRLRTRAYPVGPLTMIAHCADFQLAGFIIHAFQLQHDAVDPVGYILCRDHAKIGVATDFGQTTQMTDFQLRDCNTLVLESNYDLNMLAASSRPWQLKQRILSPIGHISNLDNAALLSRIVTPSTSNLILAHISNDCNEYHIAEGTARQQLAALQRQDITVACGRREGAIPTVWC